MDPNYSTQLPDGTIRYWTDEEIAERQAEEAADRAAKEAEAAGTPIQQLTAAVKALPVEKRTNAVWGGFVSQCLLAINPPDGQPDMEAATYLMNNSQTEDADYLAIINQAKQLFGLN